MPRMLSVVMPCFNCQDTMEEAVASIYTQDLKIPFEVVMVDDGSTDSTPDLIAALSARYPNIRHACHPENRGGGATRNTAIDISEGELIFCLDSDNVLAPGVLSRMAAFLEERNCDGVAFHERRYFHGNDLRRYRSAYHTILDRPLSLEDALLGSDPIDNFMHTRASYQAAGGYPIEHGYDTQSYEIRYLGKGLKPWICPGTYYYHRQAHPRQISYFERVYTSGLHSINYYLILEDVMHLLSPGTIAVILDFDIWRDNRVNGKNLWSFLKEGWRAGRYPMLSTEAHRYQTDTGWDQHFIEHQDSHDPVNLLCAAIYCYKHGRFEDAVATYRRLLSSGVTADVVFMNLLRAEMAASGRYEVPTIERDVQTMLDRMHLRHRELFVRGSIMRRAWRGTSLFVRRWSAAWGHGPK